MAHTISGTLSVEGRLHGTNNQWHIVCGRQATWHKQSVAHYLWKAGYMAHTISGTLSVECRLHGIHNQWNIVCGMQATWHTQSVAHCLWKAGYMEHTISGTLSVEDSQDLLFIATYVLKFRDIGNISKKMPSRFPLLHVRNQR
jgi:hypothetical protein